MIGQTLQPGNAWSLRRSNFNASHPTVLYVHGYSERSPGASGGNIRNGLYAKCEKWGKPVG